MSKFDEKEIEKLLGHMPEIKDEQSSDYYYKNIDQEIQFNRTKRRNKKKSKLLPVVASIAALFMVTLLSMEYLPIGNSSFDESSDIELDEFESDTDMKKYANDEQAESSIEQGEEESMESAEINSEDSVEESTTETFTRLVHSDEEGNENLVTYFFPDEQLQLLIPVTFEQQVADPFEAFNHVQDVIPEDYPLNADFYEYLSFKETDSNGVPVVEVDVNGFRAEYPGGSTVESYLLQTVQAYFAQLNENVVKLENENGESVTFSHTGEIDQPLESKSVKKQPYKIIHLNGIDEPFYVQVPDYSGTSIEPLSIEDAFQRMKQEGEFTDAAPSLPSDWSIQIDNQTDDRLYLSIENVDGENEQNRIIAIETILLTAKSFGFENVVLAIDDIEKIGRYPIGQPIQVPTFVNPHN
ncbi:MULTISPECIES: hypothetical protein [Allobacillus]|uniref:Sigma-X negative effector n=1 Tax=Allobacillus halotolerans TaxID=570278 RepID=A0ABS6GJZ8_9BACI|nr:MULTISPECIES: hypothetical protein [Allobacillus]MBU6079545.1 hypothetical protein [Allobacillus halotolerans]TSJ69001.1 hypothetical protein FPQ10_00720 [Allobacillus sp. SKP2-8]